jgi:Zn finger protein HypA/HybF involved in hydrogenase expression
MKDNELDDLIGTEDEDHENECAMCHRLYPVSEGDHITRYCPECSRDRICGDEIT